MRRRRPPSVIESFVKMERSELAGRSHPENGIDTEFYTCVDDFEVDWAVNPSVVIFSGSTAPRMPPDAHAPEHPTKTDCL